MVDSRTSTNLFAILRVIRPSCGNLFSAISNFDKILILDTITLKEAFTTAVVNNDFVYNLEVYD